VQKDEINIVTAADSGYEQHTAVMLSSLFANTKNMSFRIFLLCSEINNDQKKLKHFVEKKGSKIEFIRLKKETMRSFKVSHHVSLATYYRLFIPEVLPKDIEKVLYLDSDMVILGNIAPLWEIDLEDYYGAARKTEDFDRYASLEIKETHPYFNAGVMLWNLQKIRETPFTETAIDYLNKKHSEILWWDQDVLNYMFQQKIKLIDSSWNTFTNEPSQKNKINILHFAGSVKPWTYAQKNGLDKYYFKYLGRTPWRYKLFTNRSYLSLFLSALIN
jgi:lipopolysaccharide biosynthesis glycosyltransferase